MTIMMVDVKVVSRVPRISAFHGMTVWQSDNQTKFPLYSTLGGDYDGINKKCKDCTRLGGMAIT